MSTHEVAELIEKGKRIDRKWNIYKILTVVICCFSCTFYLGEHIGDWEQWRKNTDNSITSIQQWQAEFQHAKNQVMNQKNRNAIVKTGNE